MKRGGPLHRYTQLRTRALLRPFSARRRAQGAEYAGALRIVARRDLGLCRLGLWGWEMTAPVPMPCYGRLDPHHVVPVGRGGARCDPANIITLCRAHHDWVHGHPLAAHRMGLLGSP